MKNSPPWEKLASKKRAERGYAKAAPKRGVNWIGDLAEKQTTFGDFRLGCYRGEQ